MNPTPYSGFPFRAKLYLWAVVLAAAGLAAEVFYASRANLAAALGFDTLSNAVITIIATGAVVVAGLYPIRLGYKVRTSVTSTLIFAATLLFPVPRVMLVAGTAAFSYRVINVLTGRSPRVPGWLLTDAGFNTAQIGLTATLTSLLFHHLGPGVAALLQLRSATAMGAVLGAVATFFAINTLIVSTMAALVLNNPILGTWRSTFGRGWHLSISALLLGVAVAIVYLYAPIGVALVIIPLIGIHQAFSNAVAIQKQTRDTLETLADTIDMRDPYTFAHSQRVSEYAQMTAQRLGLAMSDQEDVALAARVHDIGKIGVREELLKKPDRLTQEEVEEIRRHTIIGADLLSRLTDSSKSKEAILYHHERWDGSGLYRLAYEHIPVGARIIAVADAYDAMTSDRPYRKALSQDEAFAELQKGKGTQFDPAVVDSFIEAIRGTTSTAPTTLFTPPAGVLPATRQAQIRH